MDKKSLKSQKLLNMEEFLRNYCGITNEYVIGMLKNLSHHDLKEVCREVYKIPLTRVPFDIVCQGDINSGEILLVTDFLDKTAPYKNPQASLQSIIDNPTKPTRDFESEQDYAETIDLIEENMTIENVKIKSVGQIRIPRNKKGRYYD